MGRVNKSDNIETSLFLLTSESAKSVIATADDRLDKTSSCMNQEWHCTGKAVAQIMIVFTTTTYDVLKAQICDFIMCVTMYRPAHW